MTIRNQNIVCLASQDFDDLQTRKQRWMTRLSAHNRVFWVNLQMHAVTYLRYLPHTRQRLFGQAPRQVNERLWVYTPPITVPCFQMSSTICSLHNLALNRLLRAQLRRLEFNNNLLWLYTPYNAFQIGRLFDVHRVYECVDDFSSARGLIRKATVRRLEDDTLKRVDLVLTTSSQLKDKMQEKTRRIHLSPNAADVEFFAQAADESLPPCPDLQDIAGPVIGFIGSLSYWLDLPLIAELARHRPRWTFVLVGPARTNLDVLRGLANIRLVGRQPYAKLPQYLKRFDVCLNPYLQDGVAEGASPLKLYEYLAAGKPIVSTPMPEALLFPTAVTIGRTPTEFITSIEQALKSDSPKLRKQRRDLARGNDWQDRFAQVEQWVAPILEDKSPTIREEPTPTDKPEINKQPVGHAKQRDGLKISMDNHHRPLIAVNTLSVPGAGLGGGYTYLVNLLPRLIAAAPRARFHLLVTKANRELFIPKDQTVELTTISDRSSGGLVRSLIDKYQVTAWLKQIQADLYFVPYGWLPKNPPCPTVWTFQNLFKLRACRTLWTMPTSWRGKIRERLRQLVIPNFLMPATVNADRIITVSQSAKQDLLAEYPHCAARTRVIYEGVADDFSPDENVDEDARVLKSLKLSQPYYLSVSTLMRHKNYAALIRAFVRFKQQTGKPGSLVIAGGDWGGYRTKLIDLIRKFSAGDYIKLVGCVNHDDLPALYRGATAFILLSTCESFGLPALEAMACGCPTIVANRSALAEVVGTAGWTVDPDDPAALTRILLEITKMQDQRASLTQPGITRAAQFSWATAAEQTLAVFSDVLDCQLTSSDAELSPSPGSTTIGSSTDKMNPTGHQQPDQTVLLGRD